MIQLATFARQHWALQDFGNDDAPYRALKRGDDAKLTFSYAPRPRGSPKRLVDGENMWVEITEVRKPYYIGRLRSSPEYLDAWHDLGFDSVVVFLPKHIRTILKVGSEAWAGAHWRTHNSRVDAEEGIAFPKPPQWHSSERTPNDYYVHAPYTLADALHQP